MVGLKNSSTLVPATKKVLIGFKTFFLQYLNMEEFTVYVLFSDKFNEIYIGFTSNMDARLFSHNSPKNNGYTKRFQPWRIIYTENFQNKKDAMKREKELKSFGGRDFIRKKILNQI